MLQRLSKFQSTRPRRARRHIQRRRAATGNFNPRARVGRDLSMCPYLQRIFYVNPRARVGRDNQLNTLVLIAEISIHAPA